MAAAPTVAPSHAPKRTPHCHKHLAAAPCSGTSQLRHHTHLAAPCSCTSAQAPMRTRPAPFSGALLRHQHPNSNAHMARHLAAAPCSGTNTQAPSSLAFIAAALAVSLPAALAAPAAGLAALAVSLTGALAVALAAAPQIICVYPNIHHHSSSFLTSISVLCRRATFEERGAKPAEMVEQHATKRV